MTLLSFKLHLAGLPLGLAFLFLMAFSQPACAELTADAQEATSPEVATQLPTEKQSQNSIPEDDEALNEWQQEQISQLFSLVEENPLSDLHEQEGKIAPKVKEAGEDDGDDEAEEEADDASQAAQAEADDAAKRHKAESIAREMQQLRKEHAINELRIKMTQLCGDCKTCGCSNFGRTKHSKICYHSLHGEIITNTGRHEHISVRYDLPYSIDRRVQVNNALNEYRKQNRDIIKKHKKLNSRLQKMGFTYDEFNLPNLVTSANFIPPRN